MGLASSLKKVANKTIMKFGCYIIIKRTTGSSYNATDGSVLKNTTSVTVKGFLENVVNENADPKKVANRPKYKVTGEGVSPAQIILNNPKAKAEFIKFSNAPENRILDSMEEAGRIAKKYAPEGVKISVSPHNEYWWRDTFRFK